MVSGAGLLDRFLGPECINNRWNERIEDGLQEPLVDPQKDRNHNTGNAHHDSDSDRPEKMKNLKQRQKTHKEIHKLSKKSNNVLLNGLWGIDRWLPCGCFSVGRYLSCVSYDSRKLLRWSNNISAPWTEDIETGAKYSTPNKLKNSYFPIFIFLSTWI